MNNLTVFNNAEFGSIRTVDINSEPWFVGKDVCEAFGDTNYRRSLATLDESDKGVSQIDTAGGKQNMVIINESGLYSLLFQMQPQKARGVSQNNDLVEQRIQKLKRFKHWVTSEVLPSIRKHGMYAVDELIANPDLAIQAFTALKEEREKNRLLTEENERMKPKEIFADAIAASDDVILIRELAKLIRQNGVEIGQNRLFEWLRRNGYLISRNGFDYNMPTQRSMEHGWFRIKERTIANPDGSTRITKTVLVTGKGQQYFVNKFLKNN